jgi:hypothetical protein
VAVVPVDPVPRSGVLAQHLADGARACATLCRLRLGYHSISDLEGHGESIFRSAAGRGFRSRDVGPVDDVLVILLTSQVCGYYTAYGERAPVTESAR